MTPFSDRQPDEGAIAAAHRRAPNVVVVEGAHEGDELVVDDYNTIRDRLRSAIAAAHQSVSDAMWQLGEGAAQVESRYGSGQLAQLARDIGKPLSTVYKARQVFKRFENSRRRELSFEMHALVVRVDNADDLLRHATKLEHPTGWLKKQASGRKALAAGSPISAGVTRPAAHRGDDEHDKGSEAPEVDRDDAAEEEPSAAPEASTLTPAMLREGNAMMDELITGPGGVYDHELALELLLLLRISGHGCPTITGELRSQLHDVVEGRAGMWEHNIPDDHPAAPYTQREPAGTLAPLRIDGVDQVIALALILLSESQRTVAAVNVLACGIDKRLGKVWFTRHAAPRAVRPPKDR